MARKAKAKVEKVKVKVYTIRYSRSDTSLRGTVRVEVPEYKSYLIRVVDAEGATYEHRALNDALERLADIIRHWGNVSITSKTMSRNASSLRKYGG